MGPYEITAKLGEGGMGEVYRATDTRLKREVAIKVLPAAFTEDKERLARFEREAQVLAQLNHSNIAQIFGLETSGATHALVMELVPGPTLAERLESGPLSSAESLAIALQIAQALEEAHEKGIVHRDLKPQNIKASSEGKAKVLDFGLAKAMDPSGASSSAGELARSPTLMNSPTLTAVHGTQLGTILGTAAYMAPELTRGASVDRQPVVSPDGARLAFNSDRGGNLDIWELETASGGVRRLTVAAGDDWDPAYTHDGKQLLWSSNRSGNFEVWIAASDGSGARKLTADGVDAENPTVTPDGKWIVYASANPAQNGVWKIRSDGGGAERLAPGPMSVPELSPDGRWISFVDIDANRLRVIAFDGGAEIFATALPPPGFSISQFGRSRWLPGSSSLVWLDNDPTGATFLVAQEIAAGRDTSPGRRILARGTPDAPIESFAISPDGQRLFVSILQNRSELLLIDGLPGVTR